MHVIKGLFRDTCSLYLQATQAPVSACISLEIFVGPEGRHISQAAAHRFFVAGPSKNWSSRRAFKENWHSRLYSNLRILCDNEVGVYDRKSLVSWHSMIVLVFKCFGVQSLHMNILAKCM